MDDADIEGVELFAEAGEVFDIAQLGLEADGGDGGRTVAREELVDPGLLVRRVTSQEGFAEGFDVGQGIEAVD